MRELYVPRIPYRGREYFCFDIEVFENSFDNEVGIFATFSVQQLSNSGFDFFSLILMEDSLSIASSRKLAIID